MTRLVVLLGTLPGVSVSFHSGEIAVMFASSGAFSVARGALERAYSEQCAADPSTRWLVLIEPNGFARAECGQADPFALGE